MNLLRPARGLAAAAWIALAALPAGATASEKPYVPGEALVRFDPGLGGSRVRGALEDAGATVQTRLPAVPGLRIVDLPAGASVPRAVSHLSGLPGVVYAEPNYRRKLLALPNDPLLGREWAARNTGQSVFGTRGIAGADERLSGAWDLQTAGPAAPVAVVDTGVAYTHPDLAANIWKNPGEIPGNGVDDDANGFTDDVRGWDFADNDRDPYDSVDIDQGHGTHVAGVIGAEGNNGIGTAGVAWHPSIMAIRTPLSVGGEIAAFQYARDNGARVVNYSAGSQLFSASEKAAIDSAPNTLFVAAAGNEHLNNDAARIYPCSYASANIVCVGSSNQSDGLSYFSNIGPSSVDLVAPGENILSTWPAGGIDEAFFETFGQPPLSSRWRRKGKGAKWKLTRRLHKGFSAAVSSKRRRRASNSSLTSRAIDLSAQRSCRLLYYSKTQGRKSIRLFVEASNNGKRFRRIQKLKGRRHGTRFANLPRSLDRDPTAFIRFRFRGKGKGRSRAAVDDIQISCQAAVDTWSYETGTSFSAPQVAGAAALVLGRHPAYTTAELRSALLDGADRLPGLNGKVATSGRLNVAASVAP